MHPHRRFSDHLGCNCITALLSSKLRWKNRVAVDSNYTSICCQYRERDSWLITAPLFSCSVLPITSLTLRLRASDLQHLPIYLTSNFATQTDSCAKPLLSPGTRHSSNFQSLGYNVIGLSLALRIERLDSRSMMRKDLVHPCQEPGVLFGGSNGQSQASLTSVLLASEPDNDSFLLSQSSVDSHCNVVRRFPGLGIYHFHKQKVRIEPAPDSPDSFDLWQLDYQSLFLLLHALQLCVENVHVGRLEGRAC